MFRRSFKSVFVVLSVLVLSSAALALPPQDALSARPAESVYTVVRAEDLSELFQYVFSPANVEMMTSLMDSDDAETVMIIAELASQIPAKSVAVAAGMAGEGPFVQVAASMPASMRPKLDKVADGSATGADIVTLLLGEGGEMFADMVELEVQKGAKGPYYTLMEQAAFAAKDDLLLIAFPPTELEASLDALEKKENRLSLKRRFDSPNYWQMHIDMPTSAALADAFGEDVPGAAVSLFKAPLEFETAFESKPGSFLLSCAINILDSLADAARYKEITPAKGGNLFLAGGGKLLFALAAPLSLRADDFQAQPELAMVWWQLTNGIDIAESDMENLLNGSYSIVLGSDAAVMGVDVPGGYVALTGRKGAAAKILGTLMDNENFTQAIPLVPLKADGWGPVFTVDPAALPAPVVFGVKDDTLFVGLLNPEALGKTPELPADTAKMFDNPLFGVGVIDTAGIWNRIRQEVTDPGSLLSMTVGDALEAVKGILDDVLGADLSVQLIKIWSPEVETACMEFSVVDVPQDKRLLPRLLKVVQMF